jgi:hypothetical protein
MVDSRITDLEQIKEVFDKFGVKFYLVYGALLGHYRDGDFLPVDDDIDLAVIGDYDLRTRKAIGWMLHDLGFETQPIAFRVFNRLEPVQQGYDGDENSGIIVCQRNFKFTIFFFDLEHCDQHGNEYVCYPKLGSDPLISIPEKFFKKDGEIKIGKKKYLTPTPVEDYLAWAYFDNWQDKLDRRHSETYPEQHSQRGVTEEQANVAVYGNRN